MVDEHNKQVKALLPSHTAVIAGLNEVPASGEVMMVMGSDKEAKEFALKRHEYDRHKELSISTKSSLDDMTAMIAEGKLKSLKIVLKTDVHGTLEAIKSSLTELRNDEVKVNIISSGVGGITENDVELVNNSENCVLLGFNVRPTGAVKASAKQKSVEIKTYSIIYQLIDDITGMLTGMMAPKFTEENTGQAEVREVFKIPKVLLLVLLLLMVDLSVVVWFVLFVMVLFITKVNLLHLNVSKMMLKRSVTVMSVVLLLVVMMMLYLVISLKHSKKLSKKFLYR